MSSVRSSSSTSFSDLPTETKLHVLSYLSWRQILSTVSRVSQEMRTIGLRSVETLNFDFYGTNAPSDEKQQEIVTLFSKSVRILKLPLMWGRRRYNGELSTHALRHCPNLKSLLNVCLGSDDGGGLATEDFFRALETHGKSVRIVGLNSVNLGAASTSLLGVKNLTDISLKSSTGVTDHILAEIGKLCRQLGRFVHRSYPGPPQYSDVGMNEFLGGVKGTIKILELEAHTLSDVSFQNLSKCLLLEELHLIAVPELRLAGLCSMVQLTRLRSLQIYMCTPGREMTSHFLTDETFRVAFAGKKLDNIEVLRLWGVDFLADAGLAAISESCPGLVRFQLSALSGALPITDVGARALVKNCGSLRSLLLGKCEKVTKEVFLGSSGNVLDSLPDLEYLHFTKMDEEFARELQSLGICTSYRV